MTFVSHEVRTPLNTVCMGLSLLQDDLMVLTGGRNKTTTTTSEPASSTVQVQREKALEMEHLSNDLYASAQAAVDVLNDLLHYDKIQRGNLILELEEMDFWKVVKSTVAEFKPMALEKKIDLKLDFSSLLDNDKEGEHYEDVDVEEQPVDLARTIPSIKECIVVGDEIRIRQVLRNLISNALKFSPEDGKLIVKLRIQREKGNPPKAVTLSSNQERKLYKPMGKVMLDVIDAGVGMTKQQLATVFNDSVQFNSNKLQHGKGSGLGLFIAKSMVEQHEGTLEADSKGIGHGSTFTMTLPLYKDEDWKPVTDDGKAMDRPTIAGLGISQKQFSIANHRVLVVDDSAPNRKLLVRLLNNRGVECVDAEDGLEAVKCVKEYPLDHFTSIIMDYEMPNMIGPEACQKIREMGCSTFIVGVTGSLMPEDVAYFKNSGANAVLPKPFQMTSLEQLWMEYSVAGKDGEESGM